jgi:hypothetical protein
VWTIATTRAKNRSNNPNSEPGAVRLRG